MWTQKVSVIKSDTILKAPLAHIAMKLPNWQQKSVITGSSFRVLLTFYHFYNLIEVFSAMLWTRNFYHPHQQFRCVDITWTIECFRHNKKRLSSLVFTVNYRMIKATRYFIVTLLSANKRITVCELHSWFNAVIPIVAPSVLMCW